MDVGSGSVVFSVAGRDKGGIYVVLMRQGEYCYIADGRGRKAEKPKKKKLKHLRITGDTIASLKTKIDCGERPTNTEIRKGINNYAGKSGDQL